MGSWHRLLLLGCLSLGWTCAMGLNPYPGEDWESGFVSVGQGKWLHFYHFRCRDRSRVRVPLLMFMDGGPGYSSAFGVYEHGGPYIVNNKTREIEWNPHAWNNFSDTLFVDQPAGTLFSYALDEKTMCRNQSCVAQDLYTFLCKFYETHPVYKERDLYIAGVSYGGHYAPAITGHILRQGNPDIKLKGVAVLNGLVDMQSQWSAASWFLYDNKLISWPAYLFYQGANLMCQIAMYLKMTAFDIPCAMSIFKIYENTGLTKDPYDIQEEYGPDPYAVKLEAYLNEPEVQRALHVNQHFVSTNVTVFEMMLHDFPLSLLPELSLALSHGLSVYLIYGDKDYVCSWKGGEKVAENIPWTGRDGFLKVPYSDWVFKGLALGRYRRLQNLTFVTVHNTGHGIFSKQRVFGSEIFKTWMQIIQH